MGALQICDDLTGGLAIEECLAACNDYLCRYVKKCNYYLKSLKKQWSVGASDNNKESLYNNILSEDETWRSFADSMQLISVTGQLITQIEEANDQICVDVLDIGSRFFDHTQGFMQLKSNNNSSNQVDKNSVKLLRKNSSESKKSSEPSESPNDHPSHILADFNYLNDKAREENASSQSQNRIFNFEPKFYRSSL